MQRSPRVQRGAVRLRACKKYRGGTVIRLTERPEPGTESCDRTIQIVLPQFWLLTRL
jgi:hypothetical protein